MVKTLHPLQGMQVQSPARALRSYMLCGAAKKKNRKVCEPKQAHLGRAA